MKNKDDDNVSGDRALALEQARAAFERWKAARSGRAPLKDLPNPEHFVFPVGMNEWVPPSSASEDPAEDNSAGLHASES
ncbi:MAG: hypothetical protein ITG02_00875 [Patulibacter sp.]|nr:hypothetical protein [Patulibacter sp.]